MGVPCIVPKITTYQPGWNWRLICSHRIVCLSLYEGGKLRQGMWRPVPDDITHTQSPFCPCQQATAPGGHRHGAWNRQGTSQNAGGCALCGQKTAFLGCEQSRGIQSITETQYSSKPASRLLPSSEDASLSSPFGAHQGRGAHGRCTGHPGPAQSSGRGFCRGIGGPQ